MPRRNSKGQFVKSKRKSKKKRSRRRKRDGGSLFL